MSIELETKTEIVLDESRRFSKSELSSKKKPTIILSLDEYFACKPIKKIVCSNDLSFETKLCAGVKDGPLFSRVIDSAILSDIDGALEGKYKDPSLMKNHIPDDACIIIKAYSSHINDCDQVCRTVRFSGFLQLQRLFTKKCVEEKLYFCEGKRYYVFGVFRMKLIKAKLNGNVVSDFDWIKTNNTEGSTKEVVDKNLKIAQDYDCRVSDQINPLYKHLASKVESIVCRYNYSELGSFLPLSFFLTQKYQSNVEFWANLYRLNLIDVLIKHQIVGLDELKRLKMSEIDSTYWKRLTLMQREIVLVQMFRAIPNSIPYIPDMLTMNEGSIESCENFNPCVIFNDSGDCEDYASLSKIIFNAFKQCDFKSHSKYGMKSGSGLYVLWLMANLYTESITLYRVTTAAISGSYSRDSNVTAHMNLILIPTEYIFNNLLYTEKSKETLALIQKAKIGQIKKVNENKTLIERISGDTIKSEDLARKSLIVEGTGPYCPFRIDNPCTETVKICKKLSAIDDKMVCEIYQGPTSTSDFFTHCIIGFCDLTHIGLPFDGWNYTQTFTVDGMKLNTYGCVFKNMINNVNVSFILRPELNQEELSSAHYTSRIHLKTPSFSIHLGNISSKKLTDLTSLAFEMPVNDGNFIMSETLRSKSISIAIDKCSKLNLSLKTKNEWRNKKKETYSVVYRVRLEDFDALYDKLLNDLQKDHLEKIVRVDCYLEELFYRIDNIVIVFSVAK